VKFQPSPAQIESWVTRNFPTHKRRKGGEEFDIPNPIDGDAGRHLGINTKIAKCHDWRPGHHGADGKFMNFVMKFRGISWTAAVKEICGQETDVRAILRAEVPQETTLKPQIQLPSGAMPFSDAAVGGKFRQIALNYLISRGVSEELAKQKSLMFTVGEIVFPYYEYGELVYWQSRSVLSKSFNFPPNTSKADFLFGFDDVEPCTEIIVCESIFNALSLGENAVATGGASLSSSGLQVKKIKALGPQRVILAPDNDDAGLKSLFDNFFILEPYFNGKIWYSLPTKLNPSGSLAAKDTKDWNDVECVAGKGAARLSYQMNLRELDQAELFRLRVA